MMVGGVCRYLEQEKAVFKNRSAMRVLELGAGLGLAGIVAALQVNKMEARRGDMGSLDCVVLRGGPIKCGIDRSID